MYSVTFKGKPLAKNPKMVKIEMVLFKTGYTRIPQRLSITGYMKDWDSKSGSFTGKSVDSLNTNKQLLELKVKYMKVAAEWEAEAKEWTPLQWKYSFETKNKKVQKTKTLSVLQFIEILESRFKGTERIKNGKVVTSTSNSELYLSLKNSLTIFTKKVYARSFHTFFFEDIDEVFFSDYALFLQKRGLENGNKGGVVNRLKSLRATINYASKAKLPGVDTSAYLGVQNKMQAGKTKPKTIPFEIFQLIENIDRSKFTKKQQLNIDAFLFSYYTGGMCNADVIYLTHSCFDQGKIIYERMKTSKEAKMPVLQKAVDIINKYKEYCTGDYVLPILKACHISEQQRRNRVSGFSDCVNKTLKKVAKEINYNGKITWNAARGTYITKLIDEKLPVELVAEHAGNSPDIIYKHYYMVTHEDDLVNQLNKIV